MKEVNAKEVYAFCECCLEIQRKGLEELKQKLKKGETNNKKELRIFIQKTEEKIHFLENTQSIILACYERSNKKFKFNLKKHSKFLKKVGLLKDDKE
jgi:hypothetical protein